MSIYRAAIRAGGPILFCTSLIVFAITFGSQFKLGEQLTYNQFPSDVGQGGARLVFLLTALGNALNNAAFLFFAACVLDRADRHLASKDVAK